MLQTSKIRTIMVKQGSTVTKKVRRDESMPRTRLREAREQADLTQAELAERIGAERRAVMGWEAGTHKPSAYSRRRVRKVLKNQDKLLFALDGEISNEPDVKESNELDVEEP